MVKKKKKNQIFTYHFIFFSGLNCRCLKIDKNGISVLHVESSNVAPDARIIQLITLFTCFAFKLSACHNMFGLQYL